MYLALNCVILLFAINICDASYGIQTQDSPPDNAAPYIPTYMKHQKYSKKESSRLYSGTKTGYVGTKTGYAGTKTGYAGTKTGYGGTKTGYGGTKTSYSGTKTAYSNTKTGSSKNVYSGAKPWYSSSGQAPSFEEFQSNVNEAIKPLCDVECKHNGICVAANTCECPDDYHGRYCEFERKPCLLFPPVPMNADRQCSSEMCTFTCQEGHRFIDGTSIATMKCAGGQWQPTRADFTSIPDCVPQCEPPCLNGGQCLSRNVCQCPEEYKGPQCQFDNTVVVLPTNQYHSKEYYANHNAFSHSEESSIISTQSHSNSSYGHETYGHGIENQVGIIQDVTPKGGTCLTWAGSHYKTFDGMIYSFHSSCRSFLVRDKQEHKYSVAVKHDHCKRLAYCPSELTIYLDDVTYVLGVADEKSVFFRNSHRLIPIPASLPGIRASLYGDMVQLNLDAVGITIKWDTNNMIAVEASVSAWNSTAGLCGSLDGDMQNDDISRAALTNWQLSAIEDKCESGPTDTSDCASKSEEEVKKALRFCTDVFSKTKFRKCSKVMDVSLLLEACQWDYCACLNSSTSEDCACRTVSVYAKECLRHGVEDMRSWRDTDTCPMKCPEGKTYNACGTEVQPSCASPLSSKPDNKTCVEGCYCPEGLLMEGGMCVPKSECPCRLRNKSFKPGSVEKKECNTCVCEAGEWTCTNIPCGARCSATGDPHYTTFDGLRYDFMGHCTYTFLKTDNLTVEVQNVACYGGKYTCTKAVNIDYGNTRIHLKQGGFIFASGREIASLPATVGDVRIRRASSLFVNVELPNKVTLMWDGNDGVYIDVPPEFRGKTKGLCGTFNLKQSDDFLTPEGDVEQSALAFANKWKTREFCEDIDTEEPEHPCKVHVENKEAAEKYCGKLKSKIFEECHSHVDVQSEYESCVFDMCACAGGHAARCLCPALGHYAATCAQRGVLLQWRREVAECELSCSGGQQYTVCADSCLRSCADVAAAAKCRPTCVEGCACATGEVLDSNNICVPIGSCPCFHNGMEFHSGYKEVRPGTREQELCTCMGARWECEPATESDIQNYPPAEDLSSNCSAINHMEFTSCKIAEPLTCKNMHLPPSTTTVECRPGCQCKKGYVLETTSKECVLKSQCPCHHGGRSYADGEVMQEDCNTCECKSGNWSCTSHPCAGECAAWGDSHVTTFDGMEYDFEGVCTYLLAKGSMDADDEFSVEIQNVPCGTTGATCSKSVTLKVGSGDKEEIASLTKHAALPDLTKYKRIKLRIAGAFVFLDVPSLGVSLQWDRGLTVYVKLNSVWQNRVIGLCGDYDGDMRDDFKTPSGGGLAEVSPLIFADSWKLKTTCPKAKPVEDHCAQRKHRKDWSTHACSILKRHPFSPCHAEVGVAAYVSRCESDACACDAGADCECACAAVAAYARACARRGVRVNWRCAEFCRLGNRLIPYLQAMQCNEGYSNYDNCVSACPPETCDNMLNYNEIKAVCETDTCVEGCKPKETCPPTHVYSNSTLRDCVPRTSCKPACMTVGEREIVEGEVMEEDACHVCVCSRGQKICKGVPCTNAESQVTKPRTLTTPKPNDEALCATGWTEWLSQGTPGADEFGESVEKEPLPKINLLQIGSPMCTTDKMTDIECRTTVGHKSANDTGLDADCSLERGLVCRDKTECPDFQIRVFCQCAQAPQPFQCINSTHPNQAHPDCTKFYECTPGLNPDQPQAVVKECPPTLMYNNVTMNCDWPANVVAVRPECDVISTEPSSTEPSTDQSTTPLEGRAVPSSTLSPCDKGEIYSECAFPCDKLCEHFKWVLQSHGKCKPGDKCVSGCIAESVSHTKCDFGSLWRDEHTCVLLKDCTCSDNGNIVKPGGITTNGCEKCQCLDNSLHCDSRECLLEIPTPMTHLPIYSTEPETTSLHTTTKPVEITTKPAGTTEIPRTTEIPSTTETTQMQTTRSPLIIKFTNTPPPPCSPDSFKSLLWGDEPLADSAFNASSVEGDMFKPEFSKLNGINNDHSAGSWSPSPSDLNSYIQVTLPHVEPIFGVTLQGSPLFQQYVTSYTVLYGEDGEVWTPVGTVDHPQVFRGPVDHTTISKQMFTPPIEAQYIRIYPQTCHDQCAIRFDLIGCDQPVTTQLTTPEPIQCMEPLGLAANLPIENIEVSSNYDDRKYFRLEGERGWTPLHSTPGEWIMFDFTSPRTITGIKTKGGPTGFVSSFTILYSSDLAIFSPVTEGGAVKLFPGNVDGELVVMQSFHPPVRARYLKLLPSKWSGRIEMRVEPIGCFEPYPVPETTPAPTRVSTTGRTPCRTCFGVSRLGVLDTDCDCPPNEYYDGKVCVSWDRCPCISGFLTYPVGSTFLNDKCEECVCKIGGLSVCDRVKECKCPPDLVPKLEKFSCECSCSPCPDNTRICPTSKLCLPLEQWCDGVQQCSDDEANCTTATSTTLGVTTTVESVQSTKVVAVGVTMPPAEKLKACPSPQCPPGYFLHFTSPQPRPSYGGLSDLPPPRTRVSYQRYFKTRGPGGTKTGYSKTVYTKTGYTKTGAAKGLYAPPPTPHPSQSFSLSKPPPSSPSPAASCRQFRCVPDLPPPPAPGAPPPPAICSAPECPGGYKLQLDGVADTGCPQYVCVPPQERPPYCNVTGRTINTFDGAEYKYDVCFHILARDNKLSRFSVIVIKKCRVDGCANHLLINQDDETILIKPNLMIEYDQYEYTVEQTSKICFQKNSFDVDKMGNGLVVKSRKYNFTVLYNKDGDIKVGLLKSHMGTIDGLCGTFDGDSSNDRQLPDGSLAKNMDQFGRAWAKPGLPEDACTTKPKNTEMPNNMEKPKRVWEMCDVITKQPFSACEKILNLHKWRSICLEKISECAEQLVNGTRRTEEECRCVVLEQMVGECLAADEDLELGAWRLQMDCPADCPAPLVHYDCYRKRCEPSCSALGLRTCPAEDGQCFPGCFCPEGKLRSGDTCVTPAQCKDCTCEGVGTPAKYVTFEGDDLPPLGNCTYLASRDKNQTGPHKYEVYATNGPCAENKEVICTKIVHLIYVKNVIHISKDPVTKKLITILDDTQVFKYPLKKDWVTISLVNGQDVRVALPDVHVELSVLQSNLEFNIGVPSYLYGNQTEGLCGVCAGYQEHLLTSNGTVTDDFDLYGKSWQASPSTLKTLGVPAQQQCDGIPLERECVPPPPEHNPCYQLYNADKFGACHALIDPQPFVLSCESDQCSLNSSACVTLERYAARCREQGVCLHWRGEECPLACEKPLVYRPCVDCERTCETRDKKCDQQIKAEGCFCPEGKVRVNNTCIEPNKCFPCDANKEHYAGDEWQEDACTKCSCNKLEGESQAHVSCTTQTCAKPICAGDEDLMPTPSAGECCTAYLCVPKPQNKTVCETPKKMECGFGQVLKQRTNSNGCNEFACECIPPEQCEQIPTDSEVEIMEPGMRRVVDESGCCPRVKMQCAGECPPAPDCVPLRQLKWEQGECCKKYSCEIPKDKCIVKLVWEAAPQGGEKPRSEPQAMLKDLDTIWLDGPCRSCECKSTEGVVSAQCAVTECPRVESTPQLVMEPRPSPFACCPIPTAVACRDADNIYKVGENWTSPEDPCKTYKCVQQSDGSIQTVTTLTTCDDQCRQGWQYIPSSSSSQCCGQCSPVACVVDEKVYKVGEIWSSQDHCVNYTCLENNGTLQVQSSNETCPEVSNAIKAQYVLEEKKTPGKCCPLFEPVACRDGSDIYQVNQTWSTSDPCVSMTCAGDASGHVTVSRSVQTCGPPCGRGMRQLALPHACCPHCVQDTCVVGDDVKEPGSTWHSIDNCTTYTCERNGENLLVSSSKQICPDVSHCRPESLVNGTCCQNCVETPQDLSTCVPVALERSIGAVRKRLLGARGVCANTQAANNFKECRGTCQSGTAYNNRTGSHDSKCECCQATKYQPVIVRLTCEDGTQVDHQVASPVKCQCKACGLGDSDHWKLSTSRRRIYNDIPDIDMRIKEADEP